MDNKAIELEENVIESEEPKKAAPKKSAPAKKESKKYAPNDRIECRSVTGGGLVLVGPKSQLLYEWVDYGDTTEVEFQDLQALQSRKSGFLVKPRFIIEDEELVEQWSSMLQPIYSKIQNTSWCGFYLSYADKDELYLGPFHGDVACTLIPFGKGVCGTAALTKQTQIVENVHLCKNHIACSSKTNSEIVVPIIKQNRVIGVIDLDSEKIGNYSLKDKELLEQVAELIKDLF